MNSKTNLQQGLHRSTLLFLVQSPTVPDSFKNTFNFLQGNGIYEEGVMHFLRGLKQTIWTHYDIFIFDAQALCAIFMLLFFAIKSYEMISGDKPLEVIPLLRPFALTMVIIWWHPFIQLISAPTDLIELKTEAIFNTGQQHINDLRVKRAELIVQLSDQLTSIQAQTDVAVKEADSWYAQAWQTVTSSIKEGFTDVWNTVTQLRNRMQVNLQLLVTSILETVALWLLRISTYIIFLIQIIFSTVLIILGPFSVAASILPVFKDSFGAWIARFISVNLYSGIAYLVMHITSLFQHYALEAEITRYNELLRTSGDTIEKLGWFTSNGLLSFGMVIITFIIGALCMFTVPSISTWIVSTSGVNAAVNSITQAYNNLSEGTSKILSKK